MLSASALCLIIAGCATIKGTDTIDPYERVNRKIFKFNRTVDKVAIRPIAKTYDFILPSPVKKGVNNFFHNLNTIPDTINDCLQANFYQAFSDGWRFAINSTVGIGGLFDVASHMGLKRNYQDFGLTLTKWGAKTPYIMIPILGPSTMSDALGILTNYYLFTVYPHINDPSLRIGLVALDLLNLRVNLLSTDKLVDQAFDPYIFVRNAYLQRRAFLANRNNQRNVQQDTYVEEDTKEKTAAPPVGYDESANGGV